MPPALDYVPEPEQDLLAAFIEHAQRIGLRGVNYEYAARAFLRRWPDPQSWAAEPLQVRLAVPDSARSFVMFLLMAGHLRPGYDYLVRRKLTSFWRELPHSTMAGDMDRFLIAAAGLGFTEQTRRAVGSQVIGRLLIQTGHRLDQISGSDLDELLEACRQRQRADRAALSGHYSAAAHAARQVLFHLGVLADPPARRRNSHAAQLAGTDARRDLRAPAGVRRLSRDADECRAPGRGDLHAAQ